jgi:hypothetical protein
MSDTLEKLSNNLDLLESGRYTIVAKTDLTQTKTLRETGFELTSSSGAGIQNDVMSGHGQPMDKEMIGQMIDQAVFRVKQEYETQRLQDKIAQLEAQLKEKEGDSLETAFSGVIKRLDPYIDPICDRVFGKPAPTQIAVAGFNNNNQTTTTMPNNQTTTAMPGTETEATQRVQKALAQWQEADPSGQLILVIEKIAKIAAEDKNKYNMYIPMLLAN